MFRCLFSSFGKFCEILTADRLGTFYNALPGQNRKDLVEEWAKDLYPDAWEELVKLGQVKAEEGHRLFKMPKLVMKA
jgi:hypothetical protein